MKYTNQFEESVANRPYSSDWFKERCYVVKLIMDVYYDECTYFQAFQTSIDESQIKFRILFFELFSQLYMYIEHIENGLIESGGLEKIYDLDNEIAFVLYSNVENARPAAPLVMQMLKHKMLQPISEMAHLFKE